MKLLPGACNVPGSWVSRPRLSTGLTAGSLPRPGSGSSSGDLEAALILLDEARRVYIKNPVPDPRPIPALKAKIYLKQGQLAKALDWTRARGLSADDEISYLDEFEHLILARVLTAEYQSSRGRRSFLQAIPLLERLLKGAEAQRRTASVIEILVAQALAHQVQGNSSLALVSFERALCWLNQKATSGSLWTKVSPCDCAWWIYEHGLKNKRAARAIHCSFI